MIVINFDKAKIITHVLRRTARDREFKPFDDVIARQIPGNAAQDAETSRAAIREKYAGLQTEIDGCETPDELLTIIDREALKG